MAIERRSAAEVECRARGRALQQPSAARAELRACAERAPTIRRRSCPGPTRRPTTMPRFGLWKSRRCIGPAVHDRPRWDGSGAAPPKPDAPPPVAVALLLDPAGEPPSMRSMASPRRPPDAQGVARSIPRRPSGCGQERLIRRGNGRLNSASGNAIAGRRQLLWQHHVTSTDGRRDRGDVQHRHALPRSTIPPGRRHAAPPPARRPASRLVTLARPA